MSTAIAAHRRPRMVYDDPNPFRTSMILVSQWVRAAEIQISWRTSNPSILRLAGWKEATKRQIARKHAAIALQNRPLRPTLRGSGGASPEGRRRLALRC